jgi:hypothetical protein
MQEFLEPIRWFASISGMIAAAIVSLDWGRRDTGWAMVLFCLSAIAWITGAVLMRDWALGSQNVVLLLIDVLGVYRYLIRDRNTAED